jgi:hypothetical protein
MAGAAGLSVWKNSAVPPTGVEKQPDIDATTVQHLLSMESRKAWRRGG